VTVVRDSFDPDRGAEQTRIEDLPDHMLTQLVISGSREAAQELLRRRRRRNGLG